MAMTNADTHAPPPGFKQRPLGFDPHGDSIPDKLPVAPIGLGDFPATIHALNLVRMDSGGPSWPADDAPKIPLRWHGLLPTIEKALAELDGGDRSTLDLDSEMCRFTIGEASEVEAMCTRSHALQLANVFLADFFEGWTYIEDPVGKTYDTVKAIADRVVPEYRLGKRTYSCTGTVAKRWNAAWDAACIGLGMDPDECLPF